MSWVLPVSESGHSVIFHNFSGRFSNACSQLTGVVHIGIAIGLVIAFYKLFVNLFKNFFGTFDDIFLSAVGHIVIFKAVNDGNARFTIAAIPCFLNAVKNMRVSVSIDRGERALHDPAQ